MTDISFQSLANYDWLDKEQKSLDQIQSKILNNYLKKWNKLNERIQKVFFEWIDEF